jgi:hypothetical protein
MRASMSMKCVILYSTDEFISVIALVSTLQLRWQRALWVYTLGLGTAISALCWVSYQAFE